ncbi:response regulator [Dasania sp. GY-MA-18]|uniref:Sensory/regulatory protein RpfC n=1 Tax=Dasania phycosphaerae TaxID=2950436 RepID=A0A9J6RKW6_9GAMM|nr:MULTISPECIES: response regulator [Dasania]MCR8922209.1 response regulator [Dasania sp. GY-MA-18]MCZ0864637.1 response regulator [Dasania phycosphaerae]MCZ0868365.1 response regulator [Dasania phycosphaerae]
MLRNLVNNLKNPIATKLLLITLGCGLIVAAIGISFQIYLNYRSDLSNIEQRIDQIRISTLPSIAKSLWSFDEEQLTVQVKGILDVEDVIKVAITWNDWNNSAKTREHQRDNISTEEYQRLAENAYVTTHPLVYQDSDTEVQQLGTIEITTSLTGVYQRLWQQATFTAMMQSLDIIVLTTIILLAIRRYLIRHLNQITHYTSTLNLDDLGNPLVLKDKKLRTTPDEIDKVVNSINQMRNTLLQDIEQRRRVENDLLKEKDAKLQSQREAHIAAAASQAKSQFLATMSHEIRTPMNGVIGMVELLQDTNLTETQKHYLDIIYRSGETLIEIINDILDYSKIEAGKMTIEQTSFNLEELAEDCIQLFGATASKSNLDLIGSVSPTTPLRLKGDPTRLRQILINLLGNAFKFTREGHIALEIQREKNSPIDRPIIRFSVKDTGIGINPEMLPHLFDSFNQADNSTTRKYGGTGLGLAICKQLAELMGGQIGVESTVDQGSTFWFSAQFSLCDDVADSPSHDITISTALTAKRLLIVEDNEYFCEVMYHHSLSWGMNTHTLALGADAVNMLSKAAANNKPYDFIVLDLILPDISGLELASQIRAVAALKDTPIFIVTASDEAISEQQLKELNIYKVIRKPITPSTLKLCLAQSLGKVPAMHDYSRFDRKLSVIAGTRVLAAEDNAVNRIVIKGLLSKFGVEPVFVENGKQAVDLICQPEQAFDIIFMDCDMPIMDGFEAARRIRKFEATHHLEPCRIVALTAHALQEHRREVSQAGMDDYLAKPVNLADLARAFKRAKLLSSG